MKKDIWEHAIPTKCIINAMIDMIKMKDLSKLDQLLNIYIKAGQRGLTKEENKLLSNYHSCMPDGWDWSLHNVDHLARYKIVGIKVMY